MKTIFMIAALTLSGCEHWDHCENTGDCYSPAICVSGRCEAFEESDATNNASVANNNTTDNVQGTNNGSTGSGNNSTSGSTHNENPTPDGICIVDSMTACSDPAEDQRRNDTPATAGRPSDEHGCFFSDTLTHASYSVTGQLCGHEIADWYVQDIATCRSNTIIAKVTATPTAACQQNDWQLSLRRGSDKLLCSDSTVNCTQEGTSKTVRWLVVPGTSLARYHYGIEAAGLVQFPYTIEFSIE